ncbi:MAG: MBL fold metallo-hydrolase [Oscillospiraceae bacterium]|jgi:ribonuclease BN (tRNA processing enzyme)|nr:MBL fold metallo-hydrolase [Oscillospiraceae bacterium]
MSKIFEVTFLGTNGSCAYNNSKRIKYGTNTICCAVRAGNEVIILDAGTGLCGIVDLPDYDIEKINIFLSHYHLDHIEGLLFFPDLYEKKKTINIYGLGDVKKTLQDVIAPPLSPVGPEVFLADVRYFDVNHNTEIKLSDGVVVKSYELSHPGKCLAYRIDYNGKSLCYCVDVELANHKDDMELINFCKDSDLLILDSSFEDGKVIPGWGHSSPGECAEFARLANPKRLFLYHYNFHATDKDIDKMADSARNIFPNTFTAEDAMDIRL